jgi:hypothetical protein
VLRLIAHNEQVLLRVLNSFLVLPQLLPNKDLKVQDKNETLNRHPWAGTAAQ